MHLGTSSVYELKCSVSGHCNYYYQRLILINFMWSFLRVGIVFFFVFVFWSNNRLCILTWSRIIKLLLVAKLSILFARLKGHVNVFQWQFAFSFGNTNGPMRNFDHFIKWTLLLISPFCTKAAGKRYEIRRQYSLLVKTESQAPSYKIISASAVASQSPYLI